jgi:hypothetical protein
MAVIVSEYSNEYKREDGELDRRKVYEILSQSAEENKFFFFYIEHSLEAQGVNAYITQCAMADKKQSFNESPFYGFSRCLARCRRYPGP